MTNQSSIGKLTRLSTFLLALLTVAIAMVLESPASSAFEFKKVVDNHTLIPNGGGAFFSVRGAPATSGDWVTFDTGDLSIWRATKNGKGLRKLINQNTRIPGGWGRFRQFFANYMQIHGENLVLVADACGGCGGGVGIFTRSVFGGPITKLVDRNDTSNTFPGEDKRFGGFGPDFRIGDGTVVFQNRQQVFAVPIGGGAVTAVAGPQDAGFDPPGGYCCIFDNPSVQGNKVFLRGGNVFGRSTLDTVNKNGNPLSFRFIATNTTHAPHTPSDYRFDDFEWFSPVIDETLVFGGGSTVPGVSPAPDYIRGIYTRGEGSRRLADSNQAVPGGTGNFKFVWYGIKSPIVASNGIVVFGATDGNNKVGLYAVQRSGGPIQKIIAEGDPINGQIVGGLDIGRAALSGSTLAFHVTYANFQGSGIYSTEVVLP